MPTVGEGIRRPLRLGGRFKKGKPNETGKRAQLSWGSEIQAHKQA